MVVALMIVAGVGAAVATPATASPRPASDSSSGTVTANDWTWAPH